METNKDNFDYTRRNRFTGESIELTKEECEKHDKIFYHEALATLEEGHGLTAMAHGPRAYGPGAEGSRTKTDLA